MPVKLIDTLKKLRFKNFIYIALGLIRVWKMFTVLDENETEVELVFVSSVIKMLFLYSVVFFKHMRKQSGFVSKQGHPGHSCNRSIVSFSECCFYLQLVFIFNA